MKTIKTQFPEPAHNYRARTLTNRFERMVNDAIEAYPKLNILGSWNKVYETGEIVILNIKEAKKIDVYVSFFTHKGFIFRTNGRKTELNNILKNTT